MKFHSLLFILFLFCVGNLSTQAYANQGSNKSLYPRTIWEAVQSLEGCKKEYVFDVLGLPDLEREINRTKYFSWQIQPRPVIYSCRLDAPVGDILHKIYMANFANGCKHIYNRIINYYQNHLPQNQTVCPHRTTFYGNKKLKYDKSFNAY